MHAVTLQVARRFPRCATARLSLLLLALVALPAAARAQATVTWDGGGDQTWTQPDSTSWSGATYQSGDTAVFAGAGTGTVTISGTVTPGQVNVTSGPYTLSGVIGGNGGIAKSGGGTLTLAGSTANTYVGATTVSGGTLSLNKSSGVVAVPGNLTVSGSGTIVSFPGSRNGQIGDTAAVTMNATGGVFNGTGFGVTNGAQTVTDTIGSLTVSAGQFNTGGLSVWTVSGAGLIDGTAPSADTRFVGFSGSAISFDSLSVTGMSGTANSPHESRGFYVGGSSTTKSTVTVGAGGLELSDSNLKFHPGTTAGTHQGSRLVLDGNVTVSGTAASTIGLLASEGRTDVTLSSTAGTVTRTFTVADVTSTAAADLSVTIAITDGAATAATLAKAGPGTMLLTAANTYSGGTTISAGTLAIGSGGTTGSITGNVTNDGTLAFNRSDEVVFGGAISGSGGLVKDGAGELILEADNTYSGTTTINAGSLAVGNDTTTGAIAGDIVNDATLIFRRSGTVVYSGAISGSGTMLKSGSNTLQFAGSTGNTMSGLTSIAGGQLQLNKSSGNAVGGDLTISGSSSVTFLGSNQIADTAIVQVTGGHFNGTAPNTGLANVVETIGQLQVSGTNSSFTTGQGGSWTVAGAMSYSGGSGATFVGSSASTLTVGSLSLTDMTAVAGGTVGRANSFTVYGNGTPAVTTLTVGSAGLALENSRLNLRRGSLANTLGSRLVLDGGVTVTGSAASLIAEDTAGGTLGIRDVELSSTAGSHVRTFTVADATGSADPDLTVSVPITNGAATSGGITKAGLGTLLLSAANTFTGPTSVSAGTLALGGANAVAGSSGLSVAAGATLDLSALGSGLTLGSGQSLGGAGSILGSLVFGSGSSLVFSTTETLSLSGGTASFFAGTPGSRFGIDDLVGLSSSTPLDTYTLIAGTVDFTNLDNVGAGSAYDLGNGVSAYFQQGSLQVVVVPEPAGVAVWGLGLVVVGVAARRWRR